MRYLILILLAFSTNALAGDDTRMPDDLIDAALRSPAALAVVPVQDWLGLGSGARFNHPGRPEGNWRWRMAADALDGAWVERVAGRTAAAGRGG